MSSSLDSSETPVRPGAKVELLARMLDEDGYGVGAVRGVEVHAANVLPGERCEVAIEHVSPHEPKAWGRVTRRLSRVAVERVTPLCASFGGCGGCAWQHLAYPAQLARKWQLVDEALIQAGVEVDPSRVAAVVAAPRLEGYRNVAKYVVAPAPGGGSGDPLILGAYAPRSHAVVDMARCRVVEPVLERVRGAASRALAGLPVYGEKAGPGPENGVLRYLAVRCGGNGRAVVAIVTTSQASRPEFAEKVAQAAAELGEHPEVAGVMWIKNDATSSVMLAGEAICLVGKDSVVERVAGVEIDVGVADFFQVNRMQAARLYAEVTRLAGSYSRSDTSSSGRITEHVIDLYCGVGGITFALARAAPTRQVLGIERNEAAVRTAQIAATRALLGGRVWFRAASAQKVAVLSAEIYGRDGADLIVVNPPRKGLDDDTFAALRVIDPLHLLYVSCNPESLAYDLARLVTRGPYRIDEIVPIDLMPGTAHIETVVALSQLE